MLSVGAICLKIGSVLAERVEHGVGRIPLGDSAWQLAIEKAWSALDGMFFCGNLPCTDSISCFLGSFQSGGVLSGQRPPTIECLVMSGCGKGHEPAKNF